MPFLPYQDPNNPDNQNTQPLLTSGDSGYIGQQQAQTSAQKTNKPTNSGRWTNLQNYLEANKPQTEAMTGKVVDKINTTATEGQNKVNQASNIFNSQVSANTVNKDQSVLDAVKNTPTMLNDDQKNTFIKMRDANYQGPQYLDQMGDDYSQGAQSINKAYDMQQATTSEGGRNTLLEETFRRPTYSRGEQKLDQLLLQNNEQARQGFQGVRNQWSGLQDWLTGKNQVAQDLASQAAATTQDAQTQARNTVDTSLNNIQATIDKRLADTRTNTQSLNDSLYNDVQDDKWTQATLDNLGINNGQHLYDVNLNQYIQRFNPDSLNSQNMATADEYAKYAALAALSGKGENYLNDQTQVGTATPESWLDAQGLKDYLQKKDTDYNTEYTTPNSIDIRNGQIGVWDYAMYHGLNFNKNTDYKTLETQYLPQAIAKMNAASGDLKDTSTEKGAIYQNIVIPMQGLLNNFKDRWNYNRTVGKEG